MVCIGEISTATASASRTPWLCGLGLNYVHEMETANPFRGTRLGSLAE
jgi:hypothetical protein